MFLYGLILGLIVGFVLSILMLTFMPIDGINDYFAWLDDFRGLFSLPARNIKATEDSQDAPSPEDSPSPSPSPAPSPSSAY